MQSIFSMTDEEFEKAINAFLATDFTFDELVVKLVRLCQSFPGFPLKENKDEGFAWPEFMKRGLAKKAKWIHMTIKVKMSLSWKRHTVVVHDRDIKGTLKEMAKEALHTIAAAKKIAEVLAVLEECKCSKEPTS